MTNKDQYTPDEVVVMQQKSTGESIMVYKGYLVNGGREKSSTVTHRIVFTLQSHFHLNPNVDQHLSFRWHITSEV
jgi:hypothetical protein